MSFQIRNARTSFFASREEYLQYKAVWKTLATRKELTSRDCFVHTLLTGKDLYRAFSASKKAVRGGSAPYVTLANLLYSEVLRAARSKPDTNASAYMQALHAHLARNKAVVAANLSAIGHGSATDALLQLAEEVA
jgi:hypothetical protein